MIPVVLIDDEEHGRKALKKLLAACFPNLSIVGEGHDLRSGIAVIEKTNPRIVFLDIEMPDGTGFDLLKQIRNHTFEIIFTTAFDEYALEAFRHSAIGYLLKPVGEEELIHVVERTLRMIDRGAESRGVQVGTFFENMEARHSRMPKIFLPDVDGFQVVAKEDIIRLEGERNYTHLYLTNGRSILSSYNLGHFEKVLQGHPFFRISKSHMVNLNYITRYSRAEGGAVLMSDGALLSVSDSKKESLKQLFIGL